jgi:UDP-glucuronate 4-epimerase
MRVLITGAAGFIGSHLAEKLVGLGYSVYGIDSFTDHYSVELKKQTAMALVQKGVKLWDVDLVGSDLCEYVRDIDIVYHLAAQPGLSQITPFNIYAKNNIDATYNLLDAVMKQGKCRCFVNISTSSVYGSDATGDETSVPQPTSHYGVTKLAAEQLVLSYGRSKGMPCCSMRLFSVYGPRERPEKLYTRLIGAILKEQEFPLFAGSREHRRSYTYVGDIVEGLIAVIDHLGECLGEIFNIGSDQSVSTGEGIDHVQDIIGKSACFTEYPRRDGDQQQTHANIDKARRVLNYNPQTTIRQGLEEQVKWYQKFIWGKLDI